MLHIVEAEDGVGARPPPGPEPRIRRSYHLCFQVDDISATAEQLKSMGIQFSGAEVPGRNATQLFFYDPDGNGIELSNTGAIMPNLLGQ